METTYPIRDLTDAQKRNLVERVATVSVYETAESSEPEAVITGRVLGVAITPDITLVLLDGVSNPAPVEASKPVTVTVDGGL